MSNKTLFTPWLVSCPLLILLLCPFFLAFVVSHFWSPSWEMSCVCQSSSLQRTRIFHQSFHHHRSSHLHKQSVTTTRSCRWYSGICTIASFCWIARNLVWEITTMGRCLRSLWTKTIGRSRKWQFSSWKNAMFACIGWMGASCIAFIRFLEKNRRKRYWFEKTSCSISCSRCLESRTMAANAELYFSDGFGYIRRSVDEIPWTYCFLCCSLSVRADLWPLRFPFLPSSLLSSDPPSFGCFTILSLLTSLCSSLLCISSCWCISFIVVVDAFAFVFQGSFSVPFLLFITMLFHQPVTRLIKHDSFSTQSSPLWWVNLTTEPIVLWSKYNN